jgi:rhodanese-related sulfurtransferase
MPTWVKVLLIAVVLPILMGGLVLLIAGRPLAFEVLQRRTAGRFPEVKWIPAEELALWQDDPTRPQPVLLDARTPAEFQLSHIKGAIQIDPYRPSLRTLAGFPKDTPIVVSSSAGYRGARVSSWLAKAGYPKALNLKGGLFKWANDGRPLFSGDRPTSEVHPYDRYWAWLLGRKHRAQAADVEKHSAAP